MFLLKETMCFCKKTMRQIISSFVFLDNAWKKPYFIERTLYFSQKDKKDILCLRKTQFVFPKTNDFNDD